MLNVGEWMMIVAGVLLAISLPFLANGSYTLWIVAQGVYFVGVGVVVVYYIAHRRA